MMAIKLKAYDPRWFDACVEIFPSNADPYFAEDEFDQFKAFLHNESEREDFFVLAHSSDGQIVACGGFARWDGDVTLTWGMVKRDRHGRRLGQQLLQERLVRIHQKHGNVPVVIGTSQHTQGFFAKHGFVVTKVIENGFGPGLHRVDMRLSLK